jgi:hypothetical protein
MLRIYLSSECGFHAPPNHDIAGGDGSQMAEQYLSERRHVKTNRPAPLIGRGSDDRS